MAKGHIRQRGPNAWELKYDVGVDPVTKKRITRFMTIHGVKRDAQRALRDALTAIDSGAYVDATKMTVAAWLEQWLAEAKGSVGRKTWERYSEIATAHLMPALGAIPLAKLAPVRVQAYYAEALASGRKNGKGGLSPQTVVHHARVLSAALRRAKALRLISNNPVEDTSQPRVERREIEVLEPTEAAALLAAARRNRMFPIIFLALATGLRRGEILGLRWSDVDMTRRVLTVAQSLEQTGAGGLVLKAPKTKRSRRTIALSPAVIEELTSHRAKQAADRLALGMGRDPGGLIFTNIDGGPLRPDGITWRFAKLVKLAGVKRISFHGLRHTHCTDLLRAGVHPKIASERLGHSSVAVTMDIYSHALPGLQEDAAQRIDAALRGVLSGSQGGKPVANALARGAIRPASD